MPKFVPTPHLREKHTYDYALRLPLALASLAVKQAKVERLSLNEWIVRAVMAKLNVEPDPDSID